MPNIIGLGLDATDIDRVSEMIDRYGGRFLQRIFTDGEIAYAMRRRVPSIHFAGRFAAKEAAMKALGTGHSQGVLWRDIEVIRRGGPPQLRAVPFTRGMVRPGNGLICRTRFFNPHQVAPGKSKRKRLG